MTGGMDELEARRRGRAGGTPTQSTEAAAGEAAELRGRLKAQRRRQRKLADELEGAGEAARHWRQELEILVSRATAFEDLARQRSEELDAARRSLLREQRRTADSQQLARDLESDLAAEGDVRREAERALAAAAEERAQLERDCARAEARAAAAAEQRAQLERDCARAEARAAAAAEERAQLELRLGRAESHAAAAAEAIERAASSRSWRFGHGTMKLLRRLSFRRAAGRHGSLESAAEQLREVSSPDSAGNAKGEG